MRNKPKHYRYKDYPSIVALAKAHQEHDDLPKLSVGCIRKRLLKGWSVKMAVETPLLRTNKQHGVAP